MCGNYPNFGRLNVRAKRENQRASQTFNSQCSPGGLIVGVIAAQILAREV